MHSRWLKECLLLVDDMQSFRISCLSQHQWIRCYSKKRKPGTIKLQMWLIWNWKWQDFLWLHHISFYSASYCILAASFSKRFILKLFAFAKYSNSFVTKLAHSKHLSKLVNSVKCGIIYSVFQRLFLLKYNTFSFHSQADVTCEKVHDGGSTCNYDNETILMSFMSATWDTNLKNQELIT